MKTHRSLLLTRSDVSSLLKFEEYVTVVEQAFALHAAGKTAKPGLLRVELPEGEFHIKAGELKLRKQYFALKVNGGFFHNAERFGMPNIQGVIVLFDGDNGYPLAVMDSREITGKRTGAATAVAAKYLASPTARRPQSSDPACRHPVARAGFCSTDQDSLCCRERPIEVERVPT
jgi:alanine dehydrogenase